MRATTAFNRLLALQGASVTDVSFCPEGVIVSVRLARRRATCSACGQPYRGIRTRDFEDLTAFLAQQMAKTPIAALLRIGWDTVSTIVERVVADHLDESRLSGLVQVGVDEASYRKGQRYLTCVADHASGSIVWMRVGRNAATLQAFFDELGERRHTIRAVSIDMSAGYEAAVRAAVPDAEVTFDPFHVCQLAARAVDDVRRTEWNARGKSKTEGGRWVKGVRWSLLKAPSAVDIAARRARRGLACQPPPVSGVPPPRAAAPALPPRRPTPGRRAAGGVACLGVSLEATAVREARPDDPQASRRDPRRDPASGSPTAGSRDSTRGYG